MKSVKTLVVCVLLFLISAISVSAQQNQCFSDWSEPVNLGPIVNYDGFPSRSPGLSPDELSLYFASNRPGTLGDLDFFVSHRENTNDAWGPPIHLGAPLNSPFHEAQPTITPDGHQLFFNSNRDDLGGCGGQDIHVSYRDDVSDDFGWQTPVNLGCDFNSPTTDQGPAYLADDSTGMTSLFFASDRPGSPGLRNIYMSVLNDDGQWLPPTLVEELTSSFSDSRPAIRRDGLEMFFASTRGNPPPNTTDIWVTTRATTLDSWSEPTLSILDAVFPALSNDGTTMYFTSQQPGHPPEDNIQDTYVTTRERIDCSGPYSVTRGRGRPVSRKR